VKAAAELPAPKPEERFPSRRRIRILSVVDVKLLGGLGEEWTSGLNVLALNRRFHTHYHPNPACLCVGRKVAGNVQVSASLEQDDPQATFRQLLDGP
jgi:hypothetical protein